MWSDCDGSMLKEVELYMDCMIYSGKLLFRDERSGMLNLHLDREGV